MFSFPKVKIFTKRFYKRTTALIVSRRKDAAEREKEGKATRVLEIPKPCVSTLPRSLVCYAAFPSGMASHPGQGVSDRSAQSTCLAFLETTRCLAQK